MRQRHQLPTLATLLFALLTALHPRPARAEATVVVGSKAFAESWILGEAAADLARESGAEAVHRANLGGTQIVYTALKTGSIDVYPEYTGTISEVILKSGARSSLAEMRAALARDGVGMSDSLGFNDGYALAVTRATQERYGLHTLSDLAKHPDLRLGLSAEFIGRKDGWPGLAARYRLAMRDVRSFQHDLAYQAIAAGQIDVVDIYTTDAQIRKLGLRVLEDDLGFFPRYDAVLLYRLDLPSRAARAFRSMTRLTGKIDEPRMITANAMVTLDKKSQGQAAAWLLREALGPSGVVGVTGSSRSVAAEIAGNTLEHLRLVALSLLAAILIGVPLGIAAARSPAMATATLATAGILQTIPSLALLAFLIPLFGIGLKAALVALFLYSLLPIVRNTYTGLTTIPPSLNESAEALGLSPAAQLVRVRLPLASPTIMAGIKTSAVINVGTATLAALIGARGLGEPILRGISLVDTPMILQGAIPAALLALLVQGGFDLLDRVVVPRGLRLRSRGE
jgi:osmoprotectant transport system permease protein